MSPRNGPRTRTMTITDARMRATVARKYFEVAGIVMGEDSADRQVAGGLAALAAIAASDAICGATLGIAANGQDHVQATQLLGRVSPGGETLAAALDRVLHEKQNAHYGTSYLTPKVVEQMLRNTAKLVAALDDHL